MRLRIMKQLLPLFLLFTAVPLIDAGGDPSDSANRTPYRIRGRQEAPEFTDIEAWLNSEPLTMAKLEGKIVVVHFMAFG